MAETAEETEDEGETKKKGGKGTLIALVLALVLGGAGFYAVYSGMILGAPDPTKAEAEVSEEEQHPLPDVAFVPIQPLVINVGTNGADRFLRFQAQIEVQPSEVEEVTNLMPRIVDVLNGYLRAVDMSELQSRAALVKLRGQMLRRIQVVTGEGRVRDLLIMEFVLS